MNLMRLKGFLLFGGCMLLGALAGSCSSSDSDGGAGAAGAATGGSGGTAGSGGAGGSAGAAGAVATGGAAGSAGSQCTGDQATWDSLTTGPIACTKNSDCCVIVNACTSEAQVVASKDKAAAKAAWPTCPNECNNCMPPPTTVGCTNGVCTSSKVDFADASSELMQDHCGVDGLTIPVGALHFSCGSI